MSPLDPTFSFHTIKKTGWIKVGHVDYIFVLFESNLPTLFANIFPLNYTFEQENIGSLLYLDLNICRENSKFVNSGVFTSYESFIPTYQKNELLHTLFHKSFSICCDFKTFHFEINHLKTIIMKNNYSPHFINSCIKSFLNRLYTPKVIVQNVAKEIFLLSCRSWEVRRFK